MIRFLLDRLASRAQPATCHPLAWRHDPLGHPSVQAMDTRALADLPIPAEVPRPAVAVAVRTQAPGSVSRRACINC